MVRESAGVGFALQVSQSMGSLEPEALQIYLSIYDILVPAELLDGDCVVLFFLSLSPKLHIRPLLPFCSRH